MAAPASRAVRRCICTARNTAYARPTIGASQQRIQRRWASDAPANPKIATIVDQISQLTLLETADLVSTLKVGQPRKKEAVGEARAMMATPCTMGSAHTITRGGGFLTWICEASKWSRLSSRFSDGLTVFGLCNASQTSIKKPLLSIGNSNGHLQAFTSCNIHGLLADNHSRPA